MSEFTGCEIDPGYDPARCGESLIDRGGSGYVAALLAPAVLCAVPVVVPQRSVVWGAVAALTVGAILAFVTVGGVAMMLAVTAVPAAALAMGYARLTTKDQTAPAGGLSLLHQVSQRQRHE